MANNVLSTKILLRNDLNSAKEASTLVLAKGEAFVEYTEVPAVLGEDGVSVVKEAYVRKNVYFGDGVSQLSSLKPSTLDPNQIEELLTNAIPVLSAEGIEAVTHVDDATGETVVDEKQYAKIKIASSDGENEDEIFVKAQGDIEVGATTDGITISSTAIDGKIAKLQTDLGDIDEMSGFDPDEVENVVDALNYLNENIGDTSHASKVTVVEEIGGADDSFSKKYVLYQGEVLVENDGKQPGDEGYVEKYGVTDDQKLTSIDIVKDMFLEDSEIVTYSAEQVEAFTEDDAEYGQVTEAGTYIKFVIANSDSKEIFLNVRSLVSDYAAAKANTEDDDAYEGEIKVVIGEDRTVAVSVDQIKTSKLIDDPDVTLILNGGNATA